MTSRARIGIGLAAVGRPAYITTGRSGALPGGRTVDDLRRRTAEVLDVATALGVRYVDTARSYGLAESFLGSWLAARPDVTDLVVASKWGYRYVGGWRLDAPTHEVKDHSLGAFREQWQETTRELGDRVGAYQVHSITPDSPALTDRGLHAALGDLRDGGVRVGFTTSGPAQAEVVRRALDVEAAGARVFSLVQSTWNLLEPSVGPALREAADAGLDVVVKEGVANGRLAPGADDPARAARRAAEVAARRRVTVDQVALAAVLAQPWASVVLSGATTTDQVTSNVAAQDLALAPEELADLLAEPEPPEAYWGARSARAWT